MNLKLAPASVDAMSDRPTEPGSDDPLDVRGVIAPTVTAFDGDGTLDTEATTAHARFVVDHGCHGVMPLGTNGEFALLTAGERKAVVESVCTAIDSVPVIPGVGAPSTRETITLARHAEASGADGIVAVTPYYYPVDSRGAVEHYTKICRSVDCPVYLYHIPSRTGNSLSLETMRDLADVDGIAGLKDSSKDVGWLSQVLAENPSLTGLVGSDSLLYPGLSVGCTGVVSAVANVFPELIVDLHEAFEAGELERAQSRQHRVLRVRDAFKNGPYLAGVKTALSLRDVDFDVGGLRSPLRTMNASDRDNLAETLGNLDLV